MKRVLLFVCMFMFLASCTNQTDKSSKKIEESVIVRAACFPNLTHSQALLGMAQGQFQKELGNNKIEWKTFNAGPSEIEALFAGEIDIGYIGPVPALNGFVKSKGELQIIAGATDAGAVLVSKKDLKIKDIKDLKGKKIAVPQFGNTQDLILRYILKENGLKDSTKGGDVSIIAAENPDIKTLLDKGDIDAACVPEPWGSRLIKEVQSNIILDYNKLYNSGKYSTAVVIAKKDFIQKHMTVVKQFLKAHVELTEYINNNKDLVKPIINEQIGKITKNKIPDDILTEAFGRMIITNDPEKASIADLGKVSKELGMTTEVPNIEELVNLKILNSVLSEKGQSEIK